MYNQEKKKFWTECKTRPPALRLYSAPARADQEAGFRMVFSCLSLFWPKWPGHVAINTYICIRHGAHRRWIGFQGRSFQKRVMDTRPAWHGKNHYSEEHGLKYAHPMFPKAKFGPEYTARCQDYTVKSIVKSRGYLTKANEARKRSGGSISRYKGRSLQEAGIDPQ